MEKFRQASTPHRAIFPAYMSAMIRLLFGIRELSNPDRGFKTRNVLKYVKKQLI